MRIVLTTILSLFIASNLNQWKSTTSTLSPRKIIKYDNQLVGATSGGLMLFDTVNQKFDNYEGDVNVSKEKPIL